MTETSEEITISALLRKCTRQPAQTAVLKPKCLSNQTRKDLFTAESVFLTTGHPETTADTKPGSSFGIKKIYAYFAGCAASATA